MSTSCKQTSHIQSKVIKDIEALPDTNSRGQIFSPTDDDIIRKYYPTKGAAIATPMCKKKEQVMRRAAVLGVKRVMNIS